MIELDLEGRRLSGSYFWYPLSYNLARTDLSVYYKILPVPPPSRLGFIGVFVCLFVNRVTQKLLNRITKLGGKAAHWPRKKRLDFGGNPDRVTLGLWLYLVGCRRILCDTGCVGEDRVIIHDTLCVLPRFV